MKKQLIVSFALSVLACWAAPPEHKKLAPDFAKLDSLSNVRVIVQWNHDPETEHQKVFNRGGFLHATHHSIKAGTYTLPAYALQELANDPDVKYIAPDRPLKAKLDYTAAAINAATVWNAGWDGTGVGVAVIDSGISPDPNLGGKGKKGIVYTYDFVGKDGHDQYGHGEHVAGIIASTGQSSNCGNCTRIFKGIAPGVNLIDLRVLDANGSGTDEDVISAIEMAISLKSTYNIRVINLSLGRPVYESYTQDPLCQAVEAAWKAGIVVVVAAGNDGRDNTFGEQGYGTITAPGNDPYVITVGAMKTEATYTRTDDLIASYSSKGPTQVDHIVKPDVVAPGNQVVSLLAAGSTLANQAAGNSVPKSYYQDTPAPPPPPPPPAGPGHVKAAVVPAAQISNDFLMLSGTSMATAAVSGAVADLLHANPNLTPDQVKLLLMQTAYKTFPSSSTVADSTGTYVDYYDIFTVGAGYVDLAAALAAINSVPAGVTAVSPVATYDADSGDVELAFDSSSIWATQSVWGASTLNATKCLWGAQSVWGASVVNGSKCLWGAQSVWGASVIGSTKCLWGAQAVWGADSVWNESAGGGESAPIDEP